MSNAASVMRNIPPVYPMLLVLGGLVGVYVLFTLNGINSPMIEEFCRAALYGTLAILGIGGARNPTPAKPESE